MGFAAKPGCCSASWSGTAMSEVNGRTVDIPSVQVSPGDEVAVKAKSRQLDTIEESLGSRTRPQLMEWLALDGKNRVWSDRTQAHSPGDPPGCHGAAHRRALLQVVMNADPGLSVEGARNVHPLAVIRLLVASKGTEDMGGVRSYRNGTSRACGDCQPF